MKINGVLSTILLLSTSSVLSAQQTSIRMPVGVDDVDVITFDTSRVPASDVKHWMKFAEQGYYGSSGISLSGCDRTAFDRMAKTLEKTRQVSDELNQESEYPPELLPVVNYLKRLQALRLWMGEQYLAFVRNRSAPELDYQDADVRACSAIAEHIRTEPDTSKACQLLGDEWTNCFLNSSLREFGKYPKANWKRLLDANGIQEHLIVTTTGE